MDRIGRRAETGELIHVVHDAVMVRLVVDILVAAMLQAEVVSELMHQRAGLVIDQHVAAAGAAGGETITAE
ncbi:hypothetical protein D9M68_934020 [compost metagenome]